LNTAVFKVLPEIACIAGLKNIFRVVTKKIGRRVNWKHKDVNR
jgi:hypothetical protein